MVIRLTEAPQAAVELLRSALENASIAGQCRLPTLRGKRTDTIIFSQPHPVYNLGLRDISEGHGPADAVFSAWRFLLTEGSQVIAAAEVAEAEQTGAFRVASVNVGPYVTSTAAAFQDLPEQFESEAREWLLRMLRIPALFIWTIWLHEASGIADTLSPLNPVPEYVESNRFYSWHELSEILIPAARRHAREDFNRGNITSTS